MSWMEIHIDVEESSPVPNTIQVETIVRFGPRGKGAYIRTADGNAINVIDSYEEIQQVVMKAEAKNKAGG